jgi:ribosomal-protein-alanine N-acetyltransferase
MRHLTAKKDFLDLEYLKKYLTVICPMLSPDFSPFPELATDRLLLRQLVMADAPAVQRLRSNVDVMKYINRPLTLTVADAEKWIAVIMESLEKNEGITWSVCLKENAAENVGSVGLWRIEKENHRAEIGYMLEPALHGKGIMYEAIQKVVDYGFREMNLHSIEGRIDPRNIASGAVLKKAGFVQEAHFKENYYLRDHFADTAVFSLLAPHKQTAKSKNEVEETAVS